MTRYVVMRYLQDGRGWEILADEPTFIRARRIAERLIPYVQIAEVEVEAPTDVLQQITLADEDARQDFALPWGVQQGGAQGEEGGDAPATS